MTGFTFIGRPSQLAWIAAAAVIPLLVACGGEEESGEPDAMADGEAAKLADNIAVRNVAVLQGVQAFLVVDGQKSSPRNAPVVADRDAIVHLYAYPGESWSKKEITGELVIIDDDGNDHRYTDTIEVTGASRIDKITSVFSFDVPGEVLTEYATFSVRLLDDSAESVPAGEDNQARYPTDGSFGDLIARSDGGGLRLVLVPLTYKTDGSDRTPDTGEDQLNRIRKIFLSAYPITQLDIRVREPIDWDLEPLESGDFNFESLLEVLAELRITDAADPREYYVGLANPATNRMAYCGGRACVLGLAHLVHDPANSIARVCGVTGFAGYNSVWDMAHEVGHNHGRAHAPCGPVGTYDPGFPHSDGGIGVWGYNVADHEYIAPDEAYDLMGYCSPQWISDYTFGGILFRVESVNTGRRLARGPRRPYRFLRQKPDGSLSWGRRVSLPDPGTATRTVYFLDRSDRVLHQVSAPTFERSDGTVAILVPEPPAKTASVAAPRIDVADAPTIAY